MNIFNFKKSKPKILYITTKVTASRPSDYCEVWIEY